MSKPKSCSLCGTPGHYAPTCPTYDRHGNLKNPPPATDEDLWITQYQGIQKDMNELASDLESLISLNAKEISELRSAINFLFHRKGMLMPRVQNSDEIKGRPCTYCPWCHGHGCTH